MARIRTIKPEFFRHHRLYKAEQESGLPLRVAFAGLWTACDREGRFEWEPEVLKLDCLPFDDIDFSRVLDALATRGFIEKYACSGREYGVVPSFLEHQVINNKEKASNLPGPPEGVENTEDLTRASRVDDACPKPLGKDQGERKGNKEGEQGLKKEEPNGSSKESSGEKPKRATRLPDGWEPGPEGVEFAYKRGLSADQIISETEKFENYWHAKSGQGATKLDWPATWRNWVINAAERSAPPPRAGPPRPGVVDLVADFERDLSGESDERNSQAVG